MIRVHELSFIQDRGVTRDYGDLTGPDIQKHWGEPVKLIPDRVAVLRATMTLSWDEESKELMDRLFDVLGELRKLQVEQGG